MGEIKVNKVEIEGLYVVEPKVHRDDRGYFVETFSQRDMDEAGLNMRFVQDNQSMSVKGVLRGLHFQKNFPQGKLVRVIQGTVYDVAVDMRKNSVSYGKWFGVELTDDNQKQFYIPEGFAHGFYVLSDVAKLCYKVTDYWHSNDEIGIPWDDVDLNISWPIIQDTQILIAEKDRNYKPFKCISL